MKNHFYLIKLFYYASFFLDTAFLLLLLHTEDFPLLLHEALTHLSIFFLFLSLFAYIAKSFVIKEFYQVLKKRCF